MRGLFLAAALLLPLPALAHPGHGLDAGLFAGFLHPLGGADHILAMVMVGLWAGLLGGRARFALPAAFLGAMALGGALGMAGMTLPLVQAGLLASVIVLGVMAALVVRLPLPAGMALAALFGLLHGHVHGEEMLGAVALSTAAGFLAATALLHGVGLALAMPVAQRMAPWARRAMQVAGGATAVAGVLLAVVG